MNTRIDILLETIEKLYATYKVSDSYQLLTAFCLMKNYGFKVYYNQITDLYTVEIYSFDKNNKTSDKNLDLAVRRNIELWTSKDNCVSLQTALKEQQEIIHDETI